MKTSKFLQDHEQEMAEYRAKDELKKQVKKEHHTKVIESENQLTEVSNFFLSWLIENQSKLTGKRLYIQTGKSKFFEDFLKGFDYTLCPINESKLHVFTVHIQGDDLKLRACVNGGKYEDNTYYCQYLDRTFYDVIKTTPEGVFESIRTNKSDYKKYDYSSFSGAVDNIKELKAQIKAIEEKVTAEKSAIPYSLQDELKYI